MNKSKLFEKICFCLFVMIFIFSYPLYIKAKSQSQSSGVNEIFDLPGRIY